MHRQPLPGVHCCSFAHCAPGLIRDLPGCRRDNAEARCRDNGPSTDDCRGGAYGGRNAHALRRRRRSDPEASQVRLGQARRHTQTLCGHTAVLPHCRKGVLHCIHGGTNARYARALLSQMQPSAAAGYQPLQTKHAHNYILDVIRDPLNHVGHARK